MAPPQWAIKRYSAEGIRPKVADSSADTLDDSLEL